MKLWQGSETYVAEVSTSFCRPPSLAVVGALDGALAGALATPPQLGQAELLRSTKVLCCVAQATLIQL